MDSNYSFPSYPDSGHSSPRSREIDFDNPPPPWEDHSQAQSPAYKVKFMCSYGGKIHPRPHDNQLSYISGETKILSVDRNIKFSALLSKLSALCDSDVSFKYQLPGEDLDALISVTNDDDLEHMMHEYDRLYRASAKPARMRLFLFQTNSSSFGSDGAKSERDRFVEALNSGPTQPPKTEAPENVDYFFSLEKGQGVTPPPVVAKLHESAPEQMVPRPEFSINSGSDDRNTVPDQVVNPAEIQKQLHDLQRLQIGGQEQVQDMYRRKNDENIVGGYAGDYYVQTMPEKAPPATLPMNVQQMSAPTGYWQEKQISVGGYAGTVGAQEQPMYMIHAPAHGHGTVYHTPPMVRPVTGQTGQGYYMQRMSPDVYREQAVYNMVPQPQLSAAPPPPPQVTMPQQPPQVTMQQQPPKVAAAAYSEGMGMVRPMGVGDAGVYAQMAYDNTVGRQVYYTTPGGVMPPPQQYQGVAAVSADMRPTGGLTQESKVVSKLSPASM